MSATAEKRYGWEDEAWYAAQTPRWDALEAQGWQFGEGRPKFNHASLAMFKGGELRATFYASKSLTPEEIHTVLLEACEGYAREHPND